MKRIILQFLAGITIGSSSYGQLPSSTRMLDWSRAGLNEILPEYRHLLFGGDTTGVMDNSNYLKSILDTLTVPTMILFGSGNYLFKKTIQLPSGVILKGLGNSKTIFSFNHDGRYEPSIRIIGKTISAPITLTSAAAIDQNEISINSAQAGLIKKGATIKIQQSDSDYVYSSWAIGHTGQICRVDSINNGNILLSAALRMNYPQSRSPRILVIDPVQFTGIECLKIIRMDDADAGSGSSNIEIQYASNCWVSSVESNKCNFAHVEVSHSRNLLFEDNYFHDAFSFGSGGRAYGVVLQYTTCDTKVENNIFRRLRHSMLLQAGPNGNVFAYNYSFQSRKESFPGVYVTGEDMLVHGNYPYYNLFEGNYGQFGSIDNSHGKSGPYNTFFRNISTSSGFNITNSESPMQTLTANHRLGGTNTIRSNNHHITDNSWQGNSTLVAPSLIYSKAPSFLTATGLGKIGPPAFNSSVSIPARDRYTATTIIGRKCDMIIWSGDHWENNLKPSYLTLDYGLLILSGSQANIEKDIRVKSIQLEKDSRLQVSPGVRIDIGAKKE